MTDDDVIAFREALRQGDTAAAIDRFDGFDDALSRQSNHESAIRDAVRGIIAKVPKNRPVHDAAKQYLQAVFYAQQARIEAKNDFLLHLEGGPDAEAVAKKVNTVIETNDTVQQAESDVRSAGNVPVPALVAVYGPSNLLVPKGQTVEATYIAENVGFNAASDLDVTVEGYDLTPNPTEITQLPANERNEIGVSGPANTKTNTIITVQVGNKSTQTRLQVLDKSGYLDQSLHLLGQLEDRIENVKNDGSGGFPEIRGLEGKLRTARKRIEKLINDIESGKQNEINNRIRSVINLIEAFINQVEGLSNQQLSDQNEAILTEDAKEFISALETAIQAAF